MKKITPQKFVELMNQTIQKMDNFKPGMSVYLVPNDNCPTGYSCDKKWYSEGIQGLLAMASHELDKHYIVDVGIHLSFIS
ncbi:MAG: hypothetical protein K2X39_04590 [Silvanigrellaceae bacterium]|nr:hypothetical protein [Silvanigrellaceae bacterium]